MVQATSKNNTLFDAELFGLEIFKNATPAHGSLNVDLELRNAIAHAISQCNKDRSQIREEIYELTGTDFSINSLNNWTAECRSKNSDNEDLNNNKRWGVPAEMVPAICYVTGDNRPMEVLVSTIGLKLMTPQQQVALRVSQLEEAEKKIKRELKVARELSKKVRS